MQLSPALPAALILLSACQAAVPPPPADTCGRGDYLPLVGTNIAAVTLPAGPLLRVVGPDDMVTMDYNPERTTIRYDAGGIIRAVDCG
ncbi:hypothetical protein DXV76_17775 [Rhodobacteraceae bacterium CCMM004]|nr:hypothetical protein DXV76_17775 [Rhodobacteraceae bacterium CCMM004]